MTLRSTEFPNFQPGVALEKHTSTTGKTVVAVIEVSLISGDQYNSRFHGHHISREIGHLPRKMHTCAKFHEIHESQCNQFHI